MAVKDYEYGEKEPKRVVPPPPPMEQIDVGRVAGGTPVDLAPVSEATTEQEVINFQTAAEVEALDAYREDQAVRESARVGIPTAVWNQLSQEQRDAIMETELPNPVRTINDVPLLGQERIVAADAGGKAAMARLIDELVPLEDHRSYTLMCDPPRRYTIAGKTGYYHPSTSIIHRKAVPKQREKGFTLTPQYPFLPKPVLPCDMTTGALGALTAVACEYLGHTDQEVEIHMRTSHPLEFEARKERLTRERETVMVEQARLQTEIAREQLAILRSQNQPVAQ